MGVKIFYLFMRGLGYFLKDFKGNLLLLITIATLVLMFHTSTTVSSSIRAFLSTLASTNTLRAYVDSESSELENIKTKILNISSVKDAVFYSPSEAKKYILDNAPDVSSIESIEEEFFPSFYLISLKDNSSVKELESTDEAVKKIGSVNKVSYGKEYLSRFTQVKFFVTLFSLLFTVMLATAIVFVVYNTIRLSLYKYSEEIKIYNLVGATRPFIIMPYIISSSLQTVSGYILGTILFLICFDSLNTTMLSISLSVFKQPVTSGYIISFLVLLVLSILSSSVSVISYLKKTTIIK